MVRNERRSVDNPLVFFDISIGDEVVGRIVFELFKDVVPKVCTHSTATIIRLILLYIRIQELLTNTALAEFVLQHQMEVLNYVYCGAIRR